jgi:hypothetical protein
MALEYQSSSQGQDHGAARTGRGARQLAEVVSVGAIVTCVASAIRCYVIQSSARPDPFSPADVETAVLLLIGVWFAGVVGLIAGIVSAARRSRWGLLLAAVALLALIGGTMLIYGTETPRRGVPCGL